MQKQEETRTQPGVWQAIVTGFDLTAKHPWLLILPILLDLFFWLGPRLQFQSLITDLIATLPQDPQLLEFMGPLTEVAPRTNLFTVLSVPLIGVPTLMATLSPETLPLQPAAWEVDSWGVWVALFMGLLVIGLLLTAVYYLMITAVVSQPPGRIDWRYWAGKFAPATRRLFALALLFVAISLLIYLPISFVGAIAFLIAAPIGTLILLVAPLVLVWVVIYLSMSPQIIYLEERPALRAARESLSFVQRNLLPLLLLLLLVLLAGTVVDWLLVLAENGTWLTLINIAGHAFVSTALVTALFVFYRDRAVTGGAAGRV